jgi:hypothetical protein
MNDKFQNDDVLFDRLVDGELSATERRALLESLDERPQGWRKCALAFLEAQSWRGGLRQIAADAKPLAADGEKTFAPNPRAERRTIWTAAQWLAVAAALLVAFKFGAMQRGPEGLIADDSAKPGAASIADNTAPRTAKPGDALNLWVRDDAGQMRRVRVPLVDASTLDRELGLEFQTGVPDDVRDRLQNQGFAVKSKRQYAPMWLDNGRPMIVPVEDTKIVPVSNKVY